MKEKKQMKLQDEEAQDLEMKKENEISWKKFYLKKAKHRTIHNSSTKRRISTESLKNTLEDQICLTKQIMELYYEQSDENDTKKLMDYNDLIGVLKKYGNDVMTLFNYVTQQNYEVHNGFYPYIVLYLLFIR